MKHSVTTKQIGNDIIDKCTGCKNCVKDCLFLQENTDSLEDFVLKFLKDEDFYPTVAYSCSLCNRCKKICPKNLELRAFFLSVRNDAVAQNDHSAPLKKHSSIHMHQKLGFSKLFCIIKKGGSKK